MRATIKYALVLFSGLMTVANTDLGTISAGLKYNNFTYTDKPQRATPQWPKPYLCWWRV